jgi:hypothetical protein
MSFKLNVIGLRPPVRPTVVWRGPGAVTGKPRHDDDSGGTRRSEYRAWELPVSSREQAAWPAIR